MILLLWFWYTGNVEQNITMFSFKIPLYFNLFWSTRMKLLMEKEDWVFARMGLIFELGIKETEKRINLWFAFHRTSVAHFTFNVNQGDYALCKSSCKNLRLFAVLYSKNDKIFIIVLCLLNPLICTSVILTKPRCI